jgi:hypothetical protein
MYALLTPTRLWFYAIARIEATVKWPVATNQALAYLTDPSTLAVAEVTGELEVEFLVVVDNTTGSVVGSEVGAVRPGSQPPGSFAPTITVFGNAALGARANLLGDNC